MLTWLKSGRDRRQVARSLYGSSVTAARASAFYALWGVPDTLQGRFEMIALHIALILRRLGAEGEAGPLPGVAPDEGVVAGMDDGMRELTFRGPGGARLGGAALKGGFVGDMADGMPELPFGARAVPREIKRPPAALFDRHAAYLAALAPSSDRPLAAVLEAQLAYLSPGGHLDWPR